MGICVYKFIALLLIFVNSFSVKITQLLSPGHFKCAVEDCHFWSKSEKECDKHFDEDHLFGGKQGFNQRTNQSKIKKQEVRKQAAKLKAVKNLLQKPRDKKVKKVALKQRPRFVCLFLGCESVFTAKRSLNRHISSTHRIDGQRISCRACNQSFVYQASVWRHEKEEHPELLPLRFPRSVCKIKEKK